MLPTFHIKNVSLSIRYYNWGGMGFTVSAEASAGAWASMVADESMVEKIVEALGPSNEPSKVLK